MNKIKIHILYKLKTGPFGGGNQFLKILRQQFLSMNAYSEDPTKADVILFNSFPFREEFRFKQIYNLKKAGKIIIHRVDGPISKIRNKDYEVDKIIYNFNDQFSDGTIFQSNWCKTANNQLGIKKNNFETTIINASDPHIFNNDSKAKFSKQRKIKLIATSWSANWRKGFEIYKYLDNSLDFSKYEMTFIGNSPVKFKNIKWLKPMDSIKIAGILKNHDIFITASQVDPCSNSLIEALSCGLPAVTLNDGGHREIINKAGEIFESKADVINKIDMITNNYLKYQNEIDLPKIKAVGENYYRFAHKIFEESRNGMYKQKMPNIFHLYHLLLMTNFWNIKSKLK
ncbi:glycosyltransferase [Patescibacteria group bacterium]|nr:glycosyltransferase [Patescibacteria group bacterium]MBU1952086.1 glycosyltransferase [Patescibacteria group bacterium]